MADQDRITLTVPARGEYARTVRMTATALASRIGMTYDDVEDVRMAAEEAFVYAVDTMPDDAPVTFDFLLGEDVIEIEVGLGAVTDVSDEEVERRTTYATFILQSVCDLYEMSSSAEGTPRLRLVKRAGSVDVA
jgi:serine/threonine-protein kinase RsbW